MGSDGNFPCFPSFLPFPCFLVYTVLKYWCTKLTAIAPSPTAEATRRTAF